ncbi:glycosyltransferase family 4 protein [Methylobacterium nigriterrae]|uniref:glycosyltransferase family 4 protein n=1 Tax=Methylobacterium nigriterrae TaxID=3127512 RepID=UPI00301344CD
MVQVFGQRDGRCPAAAGGRAHPGSAPTVASPLPSPAVHRAAPAGGLRLLLLQTQAENAGAQEIARLLGQGLSEHGHLIRQLFFFRRTAAFDGDATACFCAEARPSGPLDLLRLLLRLRREIRRFRPDVVLCFQHYGNVIGAPMAWLAGAPRVVANQNTTAQGSPAAARFLDRWLGRLGLYGRIVAVSADAEASYRAHPRRYRERLTRIDHGVAVKRSSLDRGQARARFGLPPGVVLLGCAARLHPQKRLDVAVRMLREHPTWHLALAGQGTEGGPLAALAREWGCTDRLHLLGELGPEGVADFLASLDVFVFPSEMETFGLAAVEAAQAGLPVVANDLPVLREVLAVDGEPCAVFADSSDPDAFEQAVAGLVDAPARAAILAERGRRLAARYPVDGMVSAYDALIRGLAGAGRG